MGALHYPVKALMAFLGAFYAQVIFHMRSNCLSIIPLAI